MLFLTDLSQHPLDHTVRTFVLKLYFCFFVVLFFLGFSCLIGSLVLKRNIELTLTH